MAKGDVVNGVLNATGNFQPAAGVEVIITMLGATAAGDTWAFYDAGSNPIIQPASTALISTLRVGINNTRYLRYTKAVNNGAYTGVQTK
jgi:hypothetical protein